MNRRPTESRLTVVVVAAIAAVVVVPGALPTAPPRAAAAEPDARTLPSIEQMRAMYDKGEYQPLLQQLQRVLSLKGETAKAYNRAELLLLKADTHLMLRAPGPALAAAKEAREVATEPPELVARAIATETLLRRSQGLQFAPRGDGKVRGAPIDVVADRQGALNALLADEIATIGPKLEQLKRKRTLPGIVDSVEAVQPLRAIELTATGKTAQSDALLEGMGGYAADLIADALADMDERAGEIERKANTVIQLQSTRGVDQVRYKKQGLQSREERDLKGMLDTCAKIVPAARELSEVFASERSRFAGASGEAVKLSARVNALLEQDYSRTYRDPQQVP